MSPEDAPVNSNINRDGTHAVADRVLTILGSAPQMTSNLTLPTAGKYQSLHFPHSPERATTARIPFLIDGAACADPLVFQFHEPDCQGAACV